MLVVIGRIVWMAAVEACGQDGIDVVQRRTFGILLNRADFEFDLTMVGYICVEIGLIERPGYET